MSYLTLARKYRPQTFDEIVGQDHVATTLKNAIGMDRVAHAYLFAGPRGVGKTSTARILAKGLNCEKGPTTAPCGKCASCNEISKGTSFDVIEIDGASNRGIDEIRNLRENIKFASVHGKFKLYIIDEVHMLTQEAFNALLKTLEEPPMHVKFIFATTRPYKVLPTIISRCQRFDFRKIPAQKIVEKLKEIQEKEKLSVSDEAVFTIAKEADGSLRDAEVILDQLLAFKKGKVETVDVVKVLGLLEKGALFDIADSLISNDKNKILTVLNELVSGGKDPLFIASSIIEHFRNLMAVKVAHPEDRSYVQVADEDYHRLEEEAAKLSLDEILYVTYTLSNAMEMMRKSALSQIPLEIALIKLTERGKIISIKEILNKLTALERELRGNEGFENKKRFEKAMEREESIPKTAATEEVTGETAEIAPSALAGEKSPQEIAKAGEAAPSEVAAEKDILLFQKIKSSWNKILTFVKNKKMSLAMFLSEGVLIKVKGNKLEIGFTKNNSLHKEELEKNTNKKFIEEVIQSIVGENVILETETLQAPLEAVLEPLPAEEETDRIPGQSVNNMDPIVESALDVFDGRIVDIREGKAKERK